MDDWLAEILTELVNESECVLDGTYLAEIQQLVAEYMQEIEFDKLALETIRPIMHNVVIEAMDECARERSALEILDHVRDCAVHLTAVDHPRRVQAACLGRACRE